MIHNSCRDDAMSNKKIRQLKMYDFMSYPE